MRLVLLLLLFPAICSAQVEEGKVYYINSNYVQLYASPESSSNPLQILDFQVGVYVKKSEPQWSQISYQSKSGYVLTQYLSSSLYEIRENNRIRQVLNGYKNLNSEEKEKIINHRIWIGMPSELAKLSWGEPSDVNRTITASMVREQWIYRSSFYKTRYLYFENGKLVTMQD